MRKLLGMLRKTRMGRVAARTAKAPWRFLFEISHPGVPYEHTVKRVRCGEHRIRVECRRWGDEIILNECFSQKQYDLPRGEQGRLARQIYQRIVASGKRPLIVDCGANIGASALWFAHSYPEAAIVAIEPAPDNFAILKRNCNGYDMDLRNAAIGDHDGAAHLVTEGQMAYSYRTNFEGVGLHVDLVSLRSLLQSRPESVYTPFLLKVDIEGAEEDLFCTDHHLLNRFPVILAELHDTFFPGKGTSHEFFRFHAGMRREFAMNGSTVASLRLHGEPAQREFLASPARAQRGAD